MILHCTNPTCAAKLGIGHTDEEYVDEFTRVQAMRVAGWRGSAQMPQCSRCFAEDCSA